MFVSLIMFSVHYKEVTTDPEINEKWPNVKLRWLITREEGARDFFMRHVSIEPGDAAPHHSHPQDHQIPPA